MHLHRKTVGFPNNCRGSALCFANQPVRPVSFESGRAISTGRDLEIGSPGRQESILGIWSELSRIVIGYGSDEMRYANTEYLHTADKNPRSLARNANMSRD